MNDIKHYCYNNEVILEREEYLASSHFSDKSLSVVTAKNAVCIPAKSAFMGGIVDQNGIPIPYAFQRNGFDEAENLIAKTDFSNIKFVDKKVVYLGQYRKHHGSFLADSISKLWYALDNPKAYEYIYILTQDTLGAEFHDAARDFFKMLGIQEDHITLVKEQTRFAEIIIPEDSYIALKTWHPEYLRTIQKAVANKGEVSISPYEKIYLSRVKFSKGKKIDYGEQTIVDFFEANGFKTIYPDDYSMAEQMFFVENCKVFAAVGGASAMNVIFASKCPEVIIVNRLKGWQHHLWIISQMLNAESWRYIDVYYEPYKFLKQTSIGGPFLYWKNKNLKAFAKDNGYVIPKGNLFNKTKILIRYTLRFIHTILAEIKTKVKEKK